MIMQGSVDYLLRPCIRVEAPGGHSALFLVNTGMNGTILINRHALSRLGSANSTILEKEKLGMIELADMSQTRVVSGIIEIFWFGQKQLVDILLTTHVPKRPPKDNEPVGLIGTKMLQGCKLTIDFERHSLEVEQL